MSNVTYLNADCVHMQSIKKHDVKCKKQEMLYILIISMIDVDAFHCIQKKVLKICFFNSMYLPLLHAMHILICPTKHFLLILS